MHVYPTAEEARHVLEGYPERLCWCPYRVSIVDGTPLVIHERRDN